MYLLKRLKSTYLTSRFGGGVVISLKVGLRHFWYVEQCECFRFRVSICEFVWPLPAASATSSFSFQRFVSFFILFHFTEKFSKYLILNLAERPTDRAKCYARRVPEGLKWVKVGESGTMWAEAHVCCVNCFSHFLLGSVCAAKAR